MIKEFTINFINDYICNPFTYNHFIIDASIILAQFFNLI